MGFNSGFKGLMYLESTHDRLYPSPFHVKEHDHIIFAR